jgi:phospholipase/carboxylesterase
MSGTQPTVLRLKAASRPDVPDVVFLHGRGSTEQEGHALSAAFPGAALRAYRGPLRQGHGFAWFLNTGIGQGSPESLSEEVPKVARWIDADNRAHLPWLCGFSNGAAMAASLALADPHAYAGLMMVGGCFPVTELPAERLTGLPVLFCTGQFDMVIPREKSQQALEYLTGPSGAKTDYINYADGHSIPKSLLTEISAWFINQNPQRKPAAANWV